MSGSYVSSYCCLLWLIPRIFFFFKELVNLRNKPSGDVIGGPVPNIFKLINEYYRYPRREGLV